ncbi:hypothetical protein LIER_26281 [Lithospermum erythrorhizon]|uniref:CSC1-like protein RXW8 n=1 Tax=Lithospermum erythrorhizon TaxID=34254 RepID=A0AAV3RBS4_LITER
MLLSALLTSAGINTGVCVVFFSLYSILRKQPSVVNVYFGQRLKQMQGERDPLWFQRIVPSASWIVKAWGASEDELYAAGGLDAVVFLRAILFSLRVFSIASVMSIFVVLPLNYFGQKREHDAVTTESLSIFSIVNIKEGSRWLWVHCFALYVISCFACFLLYHDYKKITNMRLVHITTSLSKPCYFTILVRGIPWSPEESYGDAVEKFFSNYYASSYLAHQMVYQSSTVQKLMSDAEKMYQIFKSTPTREQCGPNLMRCDLCGGTAERVRRNFGGPELREKECAAAFVFFKSRYAALVASESLQSSRPISWITDAAPEPSDVYWSNLSVPYGILWVRRISVLVASIVVVAFYMAPVVLIQALTKAEKLQEVFPFLKEVMKRNFIVQIFTGYLPSVILMLFLFLVPPLMLLFSTLEGPISRSGRKRSACVKILLFFAWNVFLGNILSGSVLDRLGRASNAGEIPNQLATAVPEQDSFFMTYIMTSGWAGLSVELIQPFGLLSNIFYRFILRNKDESTYGTLTFPYHIEVPRVLFFGLLGFVYSVFAPLMLPFVLVYFFLAYLVFRNQILNVYETKYESGGLYWPIIHTATIFSLVVTQLIALAVFGLKKSTVASGFMVPLVICTIVFYAYCREKFHPFFMKTPAQIIIEMDRQDVTCNRTEEVLENLSSEYCQFNGITPGKESPVRDSMGTSTCITMGEECSLGDSRKGTTCIMEGEESHLGDSGKGEITINTVGEESRPDDSKNGESTCINVGEETRSDDSGKGISTCTTRGEEKHLNDSRKGESTCITVEEESLSYESGKGESTSITMGEESCPDESTCITAGGESRLDDSGKGESNCTTVEEENRPNNPLNG